jgi:hypothetical protein
VKGERRYQCLFPLSFAVVQAAQMVRGEEVFYFGGNEIKAGGTRRDGVGKFTRGGGGL